MHWSPLESQAMRPFRFWNPPARRLTIPSLLLIRSLVNENSLTSKKTSWMKRRKLVKTLSIVWMLHWFVPFLYSGGSLRIAGWHSGSPLAGVSSVPERTRRTVSWNPVSWGTARFSVPVFPLCSLTVESGWPSFCIAVAAFQSRKWVQSKPDHYFESG